MPQDGFLDFVREQCTKYGIVMIILDAGEAGLFEYSNIENTTAYNTCQLQ